MSPDTLLFITMTLVVLAVVVKNLLGSNMRKTLSKILIKSIAWTAGIGIIVITGIALLLSLPFNLLLKLVAWLDKS